MPQVDLILEKNPIKLQLQKWGFYNKVFAVTKFALKQNKDRTAEMEKIKQDGIVNEDSERGVDLLTKFTQAAHNHPEFMTDVGIGGRSHLSLREHLLTPMLSTLEASFGIMHKHDICRQRDDSDQPKQRLPESFEQSEGVQEANGGARRSEEGRYNRRSSE